MTFRLSVAARNAAQDASLNLVDAGPGPGTVTVYSGPQPATVDTAPSGTPLVTFTLADPAFAASVNGVKDLDADPDLSAAAGATGSAGWARCQDSTGVAVFDGTVGTSGAVDFIISSISITAGQNVNLTLGSITDPA